MAENKINFRLQPLKMEHLPHVMKWVNDGEVMSYFAEHQKPISEEKERKYLEKLIASTTDRVFSIFDDEEYIGQCSLNAIYTPAKNARLFVVILKKFQGFGYGQKVIETLLKIAFQEMELHKIWLIVRRENHKAQAMYAKLGFDFEGVLKDEYCVSGKYFDMVRMAIVQGDNYVQTV